MQGIVKNVVLSVIMLSLIPTAFNYLMQFQTRVVSTNVIGSIILGTSNNSSDANNVRKAGSKVALSIYSSFYYPVNDKGKIYNYYDCGGRYPDAPKTPSGVPDICETYVKKYDDAMNSGGIKEFILRMERKVFPSDVSDEKVQEIVESDVDDGLLEEIIHDTDLIFNIVGTTYMFFVQGTECNKVNETQMMFLPD